MAPGEATLVCRPQVRADRSAGDLLNQVGPPGPCPVGFTRAQRSLGALDDEALRLGDQVVPVVAQPAGDPVCGSTRHPGVTASVEGRRLTALGRLRQVDEPVPNSRTLGAWLDLVLLCLVLPFLCRKSHLAAQAGGHAANVGRTSDDKQVGGSDLFLVGLGHAYAGDLGCRI